MTAVLVRKWLSIFGVYLHAPSVSQDRHVLCVIVFWFSLVQVTLIICIELKKNNKMRYFVLICFYYFNSIVYLAYKVSIMCQLAIEKSFIILFLFIIF